ncbi:hypothetical protein ASPZODRAFT_134893 [Penicilliopsis zonata CBS 506.65]|uniref:RlpA-like protein double-psi beta-barrel domain-containing protein n=1 Tax=Penicilliopsis zonata CBS 506.65 TaxID=1073090 RepID=A0A1L9SCA7_9EURO|nr:hypothetical protein ASPZODRAFT_134893 [Penicilliopsis zonata CBS 506.65]OJJ44769.1 hypothetical protein ASPZODRAFT_134893 [Penicilliopsis zonata CBS 506.65]
MTPIIKSLAIASTLLAALGVAAPIQNNKRDEVIVWETVTDVVWTTIDVTTTVYAGEQATTVPVIVTTTAAETPAVTTPAAVETSAVESSATPVETSAAVETQAVAAAAAPESPTTTEPATTSVTVAAQPEITTSSSSTTSTTSAAPAATSAASSSSSSSSSSDYSGSCDESSPCTGDGTYYDTATSASAPSACGTTNDGETENVLALPVGIMTDSDCGKTVTMTYNGITATGTVVDKCMGCDDSSIDLSRHLFGELADLSVGRITGLTWYIE